MSREEANRLSSMRREEIRKNREMESNKMLRLKNILKVSRRIHLFGFCAFEVPFDETNISQCTN